MRRIVPLFAIAVFALAWTATARAQAEHYADKPIELNVHAGGIAIEDADTEVLVGGRLGYNMANGFGLEGAFDWTQQSEDFDGTDYTSNGYLYNVSLTYTFPSPNQLHVFVSGGVGAATTSPDSDLEDLGAESQTDLAIPVGGGVKWFNRTNDPSWGIRADVKDHIIVGSDQEFDGITVDGQTTNNFEFSGGISFFFGGGM